MSDSAPGSPPLLEIAGLTVGYLDDKVGVPADQQRQVLLVDDLSLAVGEGEIVGVVGESGAGKSLTALAILGLVPPPLRILGGEIRFAGVDLLRLSPGQLRTVRGGKIGTVFQEPLTALDPLFTIGQHVVEALRAHLPLSRREARLEALRLLELVALPEPPAQFRAYPHQLSGGQRQRAMIAIALACSPQLLIADEPTTALDVTIQAQILELIERLRAELGLAVLLITHDLAVVAETCDRVVVLYAGQKIEQGPVAPLFTDAAHPYTRALLASLPWLGQRAAHGTAPSTGMPSIPGQVPDPARRPPGCAFHPRCAERLERCATVSPPVYRVAAGRESRCFLVERESFLLESEN